MRSTIGAKIFSIAVALLILMGAAAALSLRMTRTLDGQLVVIDRNYFPALVTLAEANVNTLRESSLFRRLLLGLDPNEGMTEQQLATLRQRIDEAVQKSDAALLAARKSLNEQIYDELDFDDNVALARLDTRLEFLQEARQRYEELRAEIRTAVDAGQIAEARKLLWELTDHSDSFSRRMDSARNEMQLIASNAILGTRNYQQRVIDISIALLAIAGLLGLVVAAAVTMGLVRPVRRLLHGTAAVEQGALDTMVPVTSRTRSASSRAPSIRWSANCAPKRKSAIPLASTSTRASSPVCSTDRN